VNKPATVLHRMFHFDWASWRCLKPEKQHSAVEEAKALLRRWRAQDSPQGHRTECELYSLLGNNADLMMVSVFESMEAVNVFQLQLAQTALNSYLSIINSYLSITESADGRQGPISMVDHAAFEKRRYLCFYPMIGLPLKPAPLYTPRITDHRERIVDSLSRIAKQHVDEVEQFVSGSIGLDGWEWAIDMFGDDPLLFKALIYELRFNELHAIAATSSGFYLGLRLPFDDFGRWIASISEESSDSC
jgi:peroxiredoxin